MAIKRRKPAAATGSGGAASGPSASIPWREAPASLVRRTAFALVYGGTGTGRTTFALTAPGPIALLHDAEKVDGLISRAKAEGKVVRDLSFRLDLGAGSGILTNPQEIATRANAVFAQFRAAFEDAKGWARTIVIDTDTAAWQLLRLARFGKMAQVKPHHYGPVNAEWISLFKYFRDQDAHNLIVISQMREQYRNDSPTGTMEPSGQKEMAYMADLVVQTHKDPMKGTFWGVIEKGWFNAAVEGTELPGELSTWGNVLGLVTDTDPEEWE